ncbi:arrestin domain-containing protein 3-like [Haliotis rubra]|uniref:arrestin domain-containing protein 3-like n=1 Tax=Haliotis rubra TaxID=36100 RepID=UPI001EE509A8|nr:arrestin domain-containing protein 3-like [Haliotis rubra]
MSCHAAFPTIGKLKTFTITLDNPEGVYSPYDDVKGHVKVELKDKMKMRGIRLHFYGGAEVEWKELKKVGDQTYTEYYRANETYLNFEMVLFGKASGQGGDNPTLPAGSYTYPFRHRLPGPLPSSFESYAGKIRYWIKGTIDKPWKFNHTTKKVFTVADKLDLNDRPGTRKASRGEDEINLCCLWCKSGPISCKFELDRSGYVPGESIPIKAEIINHSNRRMWRSRAELHMFCVVPVGPAYQLEIPLKIIIGTIPLRESVPPRQGPSQSHLHQERAQAFAPSTSQPTPTYAESTFGKVNIKDVDDTEYTKGDTDYAPMYAYYNEGSTAESATGDKETSAPPQ